MWRGLSLVSAVRCSFADGFGFKDFSYVDASSFAIRERLSISTAFSFDSHFRQFGFYLLEG